METEEYKNIAQTLVGRRIVETFVHTSVGTWTGNEVVSIEYILDDGRVLVARTEDGGCSCGNGNWSVSNPTTVGDAVITGVEAIEDLNEDSEHGYGSATLRLFVYQDTIKTEIVRSAGTDNGYYGWGYYLTVVDRAETEGVMGVDW